MFRVSLRLDGCCFFGMIDTTSSFQAEGQTLSFRQALKIVARGTATLSEQTVRISGQISPLSSPFGFRHSRSRLATALVSMDKEQPLVASCVGLVMGVKRSAILVKKIRSFFSNLGL